MNCSMQSFNATQLTFCIIERIEQFRLFPFLKDSSGSSCIYFVSPIHGRSYVVGRTGVGRYVLSKGNGLAYSEHIFLQTPESPSDVWGLMAKEDALRDFYCGQDVQALGIKTNQMECVLELDYPIHIAQTGVDIKPVLLQYDVECPYRIADAPFMEKELIRSEVAKWQQYNHKGYSDNYLIAAEMLISNLRIMHDHQVLHNALTYENLTWALELLDFELCRTPQHPYTKADYERHVCNLYDREVIDTYKIIIYIAGCLRETVDFKKVDALFRDYGFNLEKFKLSRS